MESRRSEVLIVEDEPLIALNLEALVEHLGYSVAASLPDARSAWELASRSAPDIAIVDLNLLDGRTGLSLARRLAGELDVGVIVATGNPDDVSADDRDLDLLRKPYTDEVMARAIERALTKHSARVASEAIIAQVPNGA